MLGLCYWVGVNEKVQNTGEPMPNFFFGVGLIVLNPALFFLKFKPPPHMGSAVFLNIGLTQTCIANYVPPFPHMGTLPKPQEDDKEIQN